MVPPHTARRPHLRGHKQLAPVAQRIRASVYGAECLGSIPSRGTMREPLSDDRLVWTGSNIEAMETFATENGFGFVVGSTLHNERWWHRAWNWLWVQLPLGLRWEWVPPEDPTVLEIYLPSILDYDDEGPYWTTVRLGDALGNRGQVYRSWVNEDA